MKIRRSQFRVRGSYPFPFDMLRVDACMPSTEADTLLMIDAGDPDSALTVIEITLTTHRPDMAPTNARWQSYGWTVTQEEVCG